MLIYEMTYVTKEHGRQFIRFAIENRYDYNNALSAILGSNGMIVEIKFINVINGVFVDGRYCSYSSQADV
jgi:hypothetical protein